MGYNPWVCKEWDTTEGRRRRWGMGGGKDREKEKKKKNSKGPYGHLFKLILTIDGTIGASLCIRTAVV